MIAEKKIRLTMVPFLYLRRGLYFSRKNCVKIILGVDSFVLASSLTLIKKKILIFFSSKWTIFLILILEFLNIILQFVKIDSYSLYDCLIISNDLQNFLIPTNVQNARL